MREQSRMLHSAAVTLDDTLKTLEGAVAQRNGLEKQLTASERKLSDLFKALSHRWDPARYAQASKLQTRHETLRRRLDRAQAECNTARTRLEEAQAQYSDRTLMRASEIGALETELDVAQRSEKGMTRALLAAMDRALGVDPMDSGALGYDKREGEYDYIPIYLPFFFRMLTHLNRLLHDDPAYADGPHAYRPVSFLEIGCGTGRNLVLARDSGLVTWAGLQGFDINDKLIALGREAFGLGTEIHVGDAMAEPYGGHDVLFTYRPFSDTDWQMAYEKRLAEDMKPGAYLLSPYPMDLARFPWLTQAPGTTNIWRKRG